MIEPIEYLKDNEGRKELVYYSLGNYVNWTSGTGDGVSNRMVGGMAQVTIDKTENGVIIKDYGVKALVTDLHKGEDGVSVYPLSEYSEQMAGANEIKKQDSEFSYEYCEKLCNEVWGDIWE